MERYDCVIIGSGPAGLEAAINLKIREKSFILFGPESLSAKIGLTPRIDNYLGMPGITGAELARRFAEHLDAMGIKPVHEMVSTVYPMGDYFAVATNKRTCEASTVILATGVMAQKELRGENEFLGRGVSYCATCDAPLIKGKTAAVRAYSPEAAEGADFLGGIAKKVYYIPAYKKGGMPDGNVEIIKGIPKEIRGDIKARELVMESGTVEADAFFIIRDTIAPSALIPGIETDGGYVKTDTGMRTNIPGCFAAGDCTGKPHQYIRAAGQGQTAALNAVAYLDIKGKDDKND